ncbi:MAG: NAD(P)-dependent alcohol dehydrogenase [Acidobacteria bacterium]|nr:NAD(P)-dependent alcohol dehydrogenase [Acidobacteriota bacterium]
MKAWVINNFGIDELSLEDRRVPAIGESEVLVKFHAASINFRDLMVVDGTYNPKMKLPAVPFSDGAGEVVEVGSSVTKWKPGDRVMPIFAQHWFDGDPDAEIRKTSLGAGSDWDGTLREFGAFDESGLVAMPSHLSYQEAATLPCAALTAWHSLVASGDVKPGETVVTLGTGGVSVFALQFAKAAGARVIATSSSEEKLERLRELGADETINYREREDWDKAILEMTGGRGADHVIEVGGSGTLPRSINATRFGGHIAMIGALTGAASFNPTSVFMKAVRVQGIYVGHRRMFEEMARAIEVNQLRPVVDSTFDFGEVKAALHHMKDGKHFGKVAVDFDRN